MTRQCAEGRREFLLQTAGFNERDRGFAIYTDITERKQREQKLHALHSVADDLTTSKSVKDVCERTITASEEILSFDLSVVSINDGNRIIPTAVSKNVDPDGLTIMSVSEGIVGKTFREQESYRFDDVSDVPESNPQGPYASVISIPIGEHGTFQAVSERPDAFSERDLELAELLVSHAESALDRITHEQQVKQQSDQLEHLTSVVSHDLRNPLNVARGRLEILRDDCNSPEIDDIDKAHQRMEELIDNILSLRDSTTTDRREVLSVENLAQRSWETVETPNATLVIESDYTITGDPSRLQQLLENLFRNTIDHSEGAVTVTVGGIDDGFYVEDTGPGIPNSERDEVFTAGYSTHTSNTGLGLAIVQNIAQTHGLAVTVTQAESGVARFEFAKS